MGKKEIPQSLAYSNRAESITDARGTVFGDARVLAESGQRDITEHPGYSAEHNGAYK